MAAASTPSPLFVPTTPPAKFGPRTGTLTLARPEDGIFLSSDTPALLAATSRGIVPHLSRDHLHLAQAIQHVQLPFESFIDRNPPVPTLVDGSHPLHTFLGYSPDKHVITMTLRDPSDGRKMPPNGNDFVAAHCTRGVRKVTASTWSAYVQKCKPDIVVALSDTPFTPPPHSQKRLTKSIERTIAWLSSILKIPASSTMPDNSTSPRPRHVLLHLAGGTNLQARAEFADRLTDPVDYRDAAELEPLNTLDQGVAGYVFDLLPLRAALAAEAGNPLEEGDLAHGLLRASDRHRSSPESSSRLAELLQSSLEVLPEEKPRVLNSPVSPHEVLRLVRDVGVDIVDSFWAQRAADIGIALDFCFPVPEDDAHDSTTCAPPRKRKDGKSDLGHNLFDSAYVHDHSRLASAFLDGQSAASLGASAAHAVCECGACSPRTPASRILYSAVDTQAWRDRSCATTPSTLQPPSTRAYVHHLLHTHEMSAHALLAMHNISVFSAFLAGIRDAVARGTEHFAREVERFEKVYDEGMVLWSEAEVMWIEVERARGKGRLAREKEKQKESTVGTAVDL
ncbi:tRNA-guanine transglycosylase [Trametes coccinea BRFM310]|uniref:tRNA-guanine transglycosylase n=1 Tax=Trametes coccinea (strain BRFM310) TaxID=1353009 RepID=A0A1Y2IQ82_TRAC3|nr:tRNA-guanine transglycosylase [Trametes coccinea BRFM310]